MPNQLTDNTHRTTVASAKNGQASKTKKKKKVLAIASAGGHWVQLQRLRPAFEGCRLIYSTTKASYAINLEGAEFRLAADGNMWLKWRLLRCAIKTAWTIFTLRPDVVISTGAAPGYFAIVYAKLLGKKTIWVDSIANAEELSLSGRKLGRFTDLWLTQWEHLAKPEGPYFYGNVLGDEIAAESPSHKNALSTITNRQSEDFSDKPSTISQQKSSDKLKIFVTIGTDLPFDRLINTVDDWAKMHPEHEIFAQIGAAHNPPKHIKHAPHIEPQEYQKRFEEADLIISHAGMGTILTSLIVGKPLIVLPRIAALGEHRNEHQLATAQHLQSLNHVLVANNEKQLLDLLDTPNGIHAKNPIGKFASQSLTSEIKSFINRP